MPLRFAFAATVCLLVAATLPAGAAEVIRSFVQTIEVDRADRLEVVEEITVVAELDQIRRGIYRDFPTVFLDENDVRHRVGFAVSGILRDGEEEPYSIVRSSGGVRIYIGDEDVFLTPGEYTYTIAYTTTRQIRRLADADELFWNVTGNDWAFPIERAEARVVLPEGVRAISTTAYTGRFGERGGDFTVEEEANGSVLTFRTTRRLQPGENLSIVVAMPPGTFPPPTGLDRLRNLYLDHQSTIIIAAGLGLVLVYYFVAWLRVGRDPPRGTIIPLFEPPSGVSAPLAQYIHERGLTGGGWAAMSAGWVSLGVRGLVEINARKGSDLSLERTKAAAPADLPKSERTLLKWLEGRSGKATINRSVGPSVSALNGTFRRAVEGESRETFFNHNFGYAALGLVLSVGAVVLAGVMSSTGPDELVSLAPLLFVIAFGFIGMNGLLAIWRADGPAGWIGGALIAVPSLAVAGLGAFASLILAEEVGASWLLPATALVLVSVNILFVSLMSAPTVNGRKMMDLIEGLILYMTVAEEKRLNMAGMPPVTPSRYETLLPYAIALDVEKPWTAALESQLARAAAAGQRTAYQPGWLHGSNRMDGRSDIGSSLGSMSRSFQSSVPPPKSSSSGRSSSSGSGGGGGGGGGGGW